MNTRFARKESPRPPALFEPGLIRDQNPKQDHMGAALQARALMYKVEFTLYF